MGLSPDPPGAVPTFVPSSPVTPPNAGRRHKDGCPQLFERSEFWGHLCGDDRSEGTRRARSGVRFFASFFAAQQKMKSPSGGETPVHKAHTPVNLALSPDSPGSGPDFAVMNTGPPGAVPMFADYETPLFHGPQIPGTAPVRGQSRICYNRGETIYAGNICRRRTR